MAADQAKRLEAMPVKPGCRVLRALLGQEREERRIRLTAMAVLLVAVMGSGAVILWQAVNNTQNQHELALSESLHDRASIVKQALEHTSQDIASNVTDRPHLKTVLGRILDDKATPTDETDLSRILDNIAKRNNMLAIELLDGRGRALGRRGEFIANPKFSAPVRLQYPAMLLWDQRYVLDQRVSILEGGRKLGEARVQLTLEEIDKLFAHQKGLGETGEFVMCASLSAHEMTCYPSRWSPDGDKVESQFRDGNPLPMHYALTGESGTIQTVDYRKQQVVAAFGSVSDSGLGMVMKRDRAEFWDISLNSFTGAMPLLLLLSVGGVWLLRWRLAPLVRNVVESRARLKTVIDSAPDAIVCLDERGCIRSFNPAAVALFGYQPSEVAGNHISLLLPEVSSEGASALLQNGMSRGSRKDGGTLSVEISVAKVLSETDAGYVATLRDVSLREQAESELKARYAEVRVLNEQLKDSQNQLLQSEKMASVGQLAAGVAHEINNPIAYVHSNLGTLENYAQDLFRLVTAYEAAEAAIADGAVLEQLQAAKGKADIDFLRADMCSLMDETRDGITRVKKIVQDLKDFSRIDATDKWHWADLQSGLDSTLNIVWNELKYKAEVRKEYADIPEVECRPSQLNQVFLNLLVNAGHAIKEKGVITIRTGQEGEAVWIEIADSGKGIAPEHLTRIFEPFFTTKPVGQGTGLGLSLSYGIVQKHGGRIEVQSVQAKGTAFKVWLPIRQSEPLEAVAAQG
ncbi:MAG: ATP-binding protein [Burkholderiales bacterium]|nr:ATP-binding protein [Burkholderiales bacterium]